MKKKRKTVFDVIILIAIGIIGYLLAYNYMHGETRFLLYPEEYHDKSRCESGAFLVSDMPVEDLDTFVSFWVENKLIAGKPIAIDLNPMIEKIRNCERDTLFICVGTVEFCSLDADVWISSFDSVYRLSAGHEKYWSEKFPYYSILSLPGIRSETCLGTSYDDEEESILFRCIVENGFVKQIFFDTEKF